VAKFALWVTCRACGFVFDSGLRMDRASFARGTLAANYHTCPNCGAKETYRKADYEVRDSVLKNPGGVSRT
jgi:rubredoxin